EPIHLVDQNDSHTMCEYRMNPLAPLDGGNLKNIGGKLGNIDIMELSEGRLLVDLDTRKALVFTKTILDTKWGGAGYCNKKEEDQHVQSMKSGVFSRTRRTGNSSTSVPDDPIYGQLKVSHTGRKLASIIITPSREDFASEINITFRNKGAAHAITFSPTEKDILYNAPENGQVVGALQGMEIGDSTTMVDQQNETMVECD
ncbi:unnamed protein product, partial [Brassica rapa subsp. narinosa]